MVSNSMMFKAGSALTIVGIVLVVANWYARPEAALAWTAAFAMFAAMLVALRFSRRALHPSNADTTAARRIPSAVLFAALIMGIPLALTLARSYGVVDDIDVARRSTGVLTGAFLAMLGNVMPKNLPPMSLRCDGARQQAFLRLAGWTWVLCGVGSVIAWLVLSIDWAQIASSVLVVAAIVVTIVQLLRLRATGEQTASGLN